MKIIYAFLLCMPILLYFKPSFNSELMDFTCCIIIYSGALIYSTLFYFLDQLLIDLTFITEVD